MRRDTMIAAIVAAALASIVTFAVQSAGSAAQQNTVEQQATVVGTDTEPPPPNETKAKTVQQKMLVQLRDIDAELRLLNHKAYNTNTNLVVIARNAAQGAQASSTTAGRLRILNQALLVTPTILDYSHLTKHGYLGRMTQALLAMCTEQAVQDAQYGYCDENTYVPPAP
jgi:hypothetical protein